MTLMAIFLKARFELNDGESLVEMPPPHAIDTDNDDDADEGGGGGDSRGGVEIGASSSLVVRQ